MAAHSAVVSFSQLLEQLLNSDQLSPNSDLQTFQNKISSLQTSVQTIFPAPKNDREIASTLETLIRDAIYESQDAVESYISGKSTSLPLPEITAKIDPIAAQAATLAASIKKEREKWVDGDIPPPPSSGIVSRTTRIVGQEEDKKHLSEELLNEVDELQILPISGMAGIGKTTLARSIYDDPKIKSFFGFRAWVTVSQDYHVGDIMARLLNSMESRGQKAGEKVHEGNDNELKVLMHQSLYNNKYLVVIDDMWEQDVWDKVRNFLPDNKNGSRIILTTRIKEIAEKVTFSSSKFHHVMKPLDEENSWILLCDKAFLGMSCPPHLERIGREIAKNCDGLPLSLTVIGGLLSRERQTEEYWKTIEEDTNAAAAKGEDAYLDILSLSYNHLPGKLKGCFLYMGAFPEDSDIPLSKLSKLWIAEGFLLQSSDDILEKVAEDHLLDLIQRNLITVRKISSNGRIKTCGLHDSLRDLAVQESGEEKFFHSVKRYAKAKELEEKAKSQRRVSVHRNILVCLKDVYHSIQTISDARTLIYAGSHHHHPMPRCLTYDLLRVLDAYTVYFIRFPHELGQLIHLRYLSMTYNGKLASSLSKLQNLNILIVRRQPRIIFVGKSFLPDDFWSMQQLRHLVITETNLPKIPENPPLFANLQSLTNINAVSCTREVLAMMPNLRKLGMWVEKPCVVGLFLDVLKHLEAFKFTVLNPIPNKMVEFQPEFSLPQTIKKLSLTGCGLPWEDMGVIAALPDLEVLKLRELAFNGEEWCPDYEFKSLKYLLIEYLNFKMWEAKQSHFLSLEKLFIRHCYELEGIPSDLGYIGGLELIELIDCSPSAMESADEIQSEQEEYANARLRVTVYCSYE